MDEKTFKAMLDEILANFNKLEKKFEDVNKFVTESHEKMFSGIKKGMERFNSDLVSLGNRISVWGNNQTFIGIQLHSQMAHKDERHQNNSKRAEILFSSLYALH